MLDLGTSFLASVSRDPRALAIVDGETRLTYAAWYARISDTVAGLDRLGVRRLEDVGQHLDEEFGARRQLLVQHQRTGPLVVVEQGQVWYSSRATAPRSASGASRRA